jgi:hypothetical protein
MNTQNKISPAIAALIVIVLIGASTAAVMMIGDKKSDVALFQDKSTPVDQSTPSTSTVIDTQLKDGTYTSSGTYSTPGGVESIGLTVTLHNGIIDDVALEQQATGGDAAVYQEKFASNYKQLVKGKKIDEINLTRVAGSSLTSNGFNDALANIRHDAAS